MPNSGSVRQRSLSSLLLLSDSESCRSSFRICGIEAAAAAAVVVVVEEEEEGCCRCCGGAVVGEEVAVMGMRRSESDTCAYFIIVSPTVPLSTITIVKCSYNGSIRT